MPVEHFMRDDAIGAILGIVLFAPVLLAPAYVFGWALQLFDFRKQNRGWRVLLSLALSVGTAPIVIFLLGSLSMRAVWAFYALALLAMCGCEWRAETEPFRVAGWAPGAAALWAVLVVVSGIDLQFGDRLYMPVLAYDFNLRTEVVNSLAVHGLPAVNPLFYPGHAVALRYHYFWFLPCALVDVMGGQWVNARQALIASDAWCGWALMAAVALFLRFFAPAGERNLETRAKWGIALLAVAGLDLLPNVFFDVAHRMSGGWFVYSSAEWWNTPVTGFPHAAFFEGHHVAAVIACMVGFLLLWHRTGWGEVIAAGLCFASSAGLSVYVSFTFALFLTAWCGVLVLKHRWSILPRWISSGAVALLCALPYLLSIRGAGGSGGSFVNFTVREFSPFSTVMPHFGFSWNQIAAANFLALPLNYFLETGAWFTLAILFWRRAGKKGRRGRPEANSAALLMFGVSLLVGTFLRSGVIANNDLGWRSVLIAQFILLIWAVDPVRAWLDGRGTKARSRPQRGWIAALIALGLASTVYDFAWMRFYIPMSDAGWVPVANWYGSDRDFGQRTFDARRVYESIAKKDSGGVVEENPNRWTSLMYGMYGLRQTAAFDWQCGAVMGGDAGSCGQMLESLVPMFNDPSAARRMDIDQVCDAWGVRVLVAQDNDPVFQDRGGWPWTRDVLASSERVRAVECGRGRRPEFPDSKVASQ